MPRMILPLMLLAVVACQPMTLVMTDAQRDATEEAVKQAALAYNATWRAQEDVDAYINYASDWAGTPWGCCETLDDLRSFATRAWEGFDIESAEDGEIKVMVFSPDAAAVTFTGTATRVDTAGVRQERANEIAGLWVREDGEWKLLIAKNYIGEEERCQGRQEEEEDPAPVRQDAAPGHRGGHRAARLLF